MQCGMKSEPTSQFFFLNCKRVSVLGEQCVGFFVVIAIVVYLSFFHAQVERDAIIWSNKTYASKPMLVKEDQAILAHRRWFAQFYSENSPRLTFRNEEELAW